MGNLFAELKRRHIYRVAAAVAKCEKMSIAKAF
jgi:hypothetical protein